MSMTGLVAGEYELGFPMTVILDEGAVTVSEGVGITGKPQKSYTFTKGVEVGDIVEVFADTAITFSATNGLPVMRLPQNDGASAGIFGRVIYIDLMKNVPENSDDANTLAKRLSGGYYRLATVEIFGLSGAFTFEVTKDSIATLEVGAAGKLSPGYDGTSGVWDGTIKVVDSSGTLPLRSFHYVGSGSGTAPALLGVFF